VAPAALVVVSGPAQGTPIVVPHEGMVFGRNGSPEGQLGGDPLLSRLHAVIVHSGHGELLVSDVGSANGTFLNGKRVGDATLVHAGDIIEMGGSKLKASAPLTGASPAGADTILAAHPAPAAPHSAPAPAAQRPATAPGSPVTPAQPAANGSPADHH
jgi:pSer/pThr/pTyr-binding forkhead associated (FHA) protein